MKRKSKGFRFFYLMVCGNVFDKILKNQKKRLKNGSKISLKFLYFKIME